MVQSETELRALAESYGQGHVFYFWDQLNAEGKAKLQEALSDIDFQLMQRLINDWVLNEPDAEHFSEISPVPVISKVDPIRPDCTEALEAGEAALCAGEVGLFLVAGGQGTRLGFDGPKGAYPVGPVSGRSLFAFHAEKIHNLQNRYHCTLPWYIMVSETNELATKSFFLKYHYFGLDPHQVQFLKQRMVPCVDEAGKFMLESPDRLAKNPNGHGGCIPAMVENGVIKDASERGIKYLCYFQVDNWAVKVADPYFLGYHVLAQAQMSSKNHRKHAAREAVGVHCLCDGEYRVIEYSELDIYPQLLDTDAAGNVIYYAGNPAIHILSTRFVEETFNRFDQFPWHRAHKKVPYIDNHGKLIEPAAPNAYKFETFVFDALRFIKHEPVALEIEPPGEYTPIKSFSGENSVEGAWKTMREYWSIWLEAAGCPVPRDDEGKVAVRVEISPQFALDQNEFLEKTNDYIWPVSGDIAIDQNGKFIQSDVTA